MNARQRFINIMSFEESDRNLFWEMGYWGETLERWYTEGLARGHGLAKSLTADEGVRGESAPHDSLSETKIRDLDVHEQLGMDPALVSLPVNAGPQPPFPVLILEEAEDFRLIQDELGVKKRLNKKEPSLPAFLSFPVSCREDFEKLKAERFRSGFSERVPADWQRRLMEYRKRDYPLAIGGYPYGFFGFLRLLLGEENLLLGFYDQPDLVKDILSFLTDFWIDLWDHALSLVSVDCAHFWEDMAYRNGPMISPAMFREFIMPFLRARGVSTILVDTDGNLEALILLFLESGVTGLYPIEIQAGNDILAIRRRFPRLQMMGGIDKRKIARGREAIERELSEKVASLNRGGGYIPHLDHLAPPDISWADFSYYRTKLREMLESPARRG